MFSAWKPAAAALETTAYLSDDPMLCKWIYGFNGDRTNTWALGKGCIESFLEVSRLHGIRLLLEVEMPMFNGEMSRVIYLAKKPLVRQAS